MKKLFVLFAAISMAATAWAQRPYAKLTLSEPDYEIYTLTFLYGDHVPNGTDEWDVYSTTYDSYSNRAPWYEHSGRIFTVVFDESFRNARPLSCAYWLYGLSNLRSIEGLGNLNTSAVVRMDGMFSGCTYLPSLDLRTFDTSNVIDMSNMFESCNSLTSLDVSSFNTSYVQYMLGMFYGCRNLTTIDLSSFNTSLVTNMDRMFYECSNLTTLDLSGFNTTNVETMSQMFSGCNFLTALDLTSFDTSSVVDMSGMFQSCQRLRIIDLSSFNTSKVTNMNSMFKSSSSLLSIIVGDLWSTAKVTNSTDMFNGAYPEGEYGSSYSSSSYDKTTAHSNKGGRLAKKQSTVELNSVGGAYWATYCKSGYRQADEGTTVYIAIVDGSTVTLREVRNRIVSGAVILKRTIAGDVTLTSVISETNEDYYGNDLNGNSNSTAVLQSDYFDYYVLANEGGTLGFYKLNSYTKLAPFKAYIQLVKNTGAPSFLAFDNTNNNATAIDSTETPETIPAQVYDLQGRRVLQPTKGFYIINGKKVIVK